MQFELLEEPENDATPWPKKPSKPRYVSLGEQERTNSAQRQAQLQPRHDDQADQLDHRENSSDQADRGQESSRPAITACGNIDVRGSSPATSSATAIAKWENAVPALKDKERYRLKLLGLSPEDFGFFVTRFVGHRWQFIQRVPDGDWYSVGNKRHLNDWELVRHLAGDIIVGTGCRWDPERRDFRTTYVVVDLDYQDDAAELRDRYDRVVAALGAPSYVIRSSTSAGLHVYYMFARSEPLHALRTSDGCRGDVVRLLEAEGLRQQNGQVEVFPRGHYRDGRGQQARVRAPFGPGSCLLHQVTLEPLARPGPASLILARQLFEAGKIGLVDPMAWFNKRQALASASPKPSVPAENDSALNGTRRRGHPQKTSYPPPHREPAKVEKLLAEGLTSRKQFNDAAIAVAFHFRNELGLSKEEAIAKLLQWLESHHNGKSETYNRSPAKARREVLEIVQRVYQREGRAPSRKRSKRVFLPLPALSEYEAKTVLEAFDNEIAACDPSTGEPLDLYKLLHFAFELLRLAKQYVLSSIAASIEGSAKGTLDHDVRVVWPSQSCNEFIVACPSSLREGRGRAGSGFLRGVGRDRRWKLWRAILASGLFTLRKPGCSLPWLHRPATYVVRLDFGTRSLDDRCFQSVDSALVAFMSPEERAARLTAYRQKLLARADLAHGVAVIDNSARRATDLVAGRLNAASSSDVGSAHVA